MVSSLLMTLKPLLDTYLPYLPYHTYIWESILCLTIFASIFGVIFDGLWFHFWITFLMSFHILVFFFRPCFLYRFFIEFRMEFGLILMFFWYLYRSHMQPSKSSKTIVFPMNFNDFTLQRNMIFDDFPDLFRYQFWHWFLMRFGIDFGSILGAFCNYFSCFFDIVFCIDFWLTFWWKIVEKWLNK